MDSVVLRLLVVVVTLAVGSLFIRVTLHSLGIRASRRLGSFSDDHHMTATVLGVSREVSEVESVLGPKSRKAMRVFSVLAAIVVVTITIAVMLLIILGTLLT